MQHLDLTLPTPEENLALDEALLDLCETSQAQGVLRFWEPDRFFVVVGYANQVETEVNVESCRSKGISIHRRCTGGGTVLQGRGCLNYSLVLRIDAEPELQTIRGTNEHVLRVHTNTLSSLMGRKAQHEGQTDLAISGLKFSGNAQRRRRAAVLFHGSFLLQFDIEQIEMCLKRPSKEPAYRRNRSHRDFLLNIGLPSASVKEALRRAWNANDDLLVPYVEVARLVQEKYGRPEWNLKI